MHQKLNSGLVNKVDYGVAVENDNIWVATTAGANRYNTSTPEWTIYFEKNAPVELWNCHRYTFKSSLVVRIYR